MTIVSSKEFISNEDKYFDLAMNDDVIIKRGDNMFIVQNYALNDEPDMIFEPDDDFYRSITADEFKKEALKIVEKVHNSFYPK
jgi:hypothetical protein